jgi:hypothetical protein
MLKYNLKKLHVISVFFLILFLYFYINYKSQAENFVELTKCEEEMITAFSNTDKIFNEEFKNYLTIPDVTSVAKSSDISSYNRTYECQTQAICNSIANPNSEFKLQSEYGECSNLATVKDLQKILKVDFSKCNPNFLRDKKNILTTCNQFRIKKNNMNRQYISTEFTKSVHLENHKILSLKILDLRKKMAVLLKKVRMFSNHFIKVIDDINCTIPSGSGY